MPGQPAPACVDFEAVTETLLDHPLTRRQRELVFLDGEDGDQRIELTARPYMVDDFGRLVEEARELKLPTTILHQLLPGLRQGHSDRQVFYARLGKHHRGLLAALSENRSKKSRWQQSPERKSISTDIIDMAILAEEDRRMTWETA